MKQPVRPDEVRSIVAQVLEELTAAATGEAGVSGQSNITLPQGVSVHWQPDKRIIDSKNVLDHGTQASFQLLADHGKRACMITARATLDGPPAVQDGRELRYWTKEDGPQREWILNSLRRQIEEFLPRREA